MIARPCIGCGQLIPTGSRCAACRPPAKQPDNSKRHQIRSNPTRWKNLSKRLRHLSPFCEMCGAASRLQVDHIIPIAEAEQLGISVYEVANLRVLCKTCNVRRGDRVTDVERAEVLARINAKGLKQ